MKPLTSLLATGLGAAVLSGCVYEVQRERVTPVEVRTVTEDGRTTVTRTEYVTREVRYVTPAPAVYVAPAPVVVNPWPVYTYYEPCYRPAPSFSFVYVRGRGRHCW